MEQVLIRALAKEPALRFDSIETMNRAFQAALAAALDPKRHAANDPTIITQRTQALYRKYQNVRPADRGGRYRRSAVLAGLLLLLVLVVSAGAVAVVNPDLLTSPSAAPPTDDPAVQATRAQATVDYLVALNATQQATQAAPGALQTEVMSAVRQTVAARQGTPDASGTLAPTP